ncbi:hypothetical protein AB0L40_10650 [Patulibacter sp. NPDC049589]|uniref:hypothetical protein n=1 Tax=Patulibacter sp. NPDC049589 TaxID=3154731 RepID=UPI0034261D6E
MTASSPTTRTRPTLPIRSAVSGVALVACVAGLSACGGGDGDVKDASDGRPFAITATARFAKSQRLANVETLRITVKNEDSRPLPDVAIVLGGLNRSIPVADNGAGRVADPRRPVWIVDVPPAGATTAYAGTWALGSLPAGATKTFTWRLTPTVAGRHTVRWRAAAALDEDGPVRASSGGTTSGTLPVRVSSE